MVLILVLDQVVKILVKTTMPLGDTHLIFGHWFQIHFIENEGMAFGMKLAKNAAMQSQFSPFDQIEQRAQNQLTGFGFVKQDGQQGR